MRQLICQACSASKMKERRCRGSPSLEFRRLDRITAQFRNGSIETNTLEQLCNLGAEALARAAFVLDGIAQDVADFLFHGAAVAGGAPLQLPLARLIQVTNDELGHLYLFYTP